MANSSDYEQEIAERVARLRDVASVEIRGLVEDLLAEAEQERQQGLDTAVEERDAAIAEALDAASREMAAEADAAIADALAEVAVSGPRALLAGVRRLDASKTLSGVLDTLVDLVAAEAGRAALFVGTGGSLRGWRFVGFDAVGDPMDFAAGGVDPGLLDRAISQRNATIDTDRGAMALPIVVGGEPMALVYADGARANDDAPATDNARATAEDGGAEPGRRAPHWVAAVEVLTRYTGCRLESLTANRVADLATSIARGE